MKSNEKMKEFWGSIKAIFSIVRTVSFLVLLSLMVLVALVIGFYTSQLTILGAVVFGVVSIVLAILSLRE